MLAHDYGVTVGQELLARGAPIDSIAFLNGHKTELDLNAVMRKRLTITGSTLRPRPEADKAAIAAQLREKVWPRIAAGEIRPLIHATFPLAKAADAHAMMESSEHTGKIMLSVREG